jgi:hypothetical protein
MLEEGYLLWDNVEYLYTMEISGQGRGDIVFKIQARLPIKTLLTNNGGDTDEDRQIYKLGGIIYTVFTLKTRECFPENIKTKYSGLYKKEDVVQHNSDNPPVRVRIIRLISLCEDYNRKLSLIVCGIYYYTDKPSAYRYSVQNRVSRLIGKKYAFEHQTKKTASPPVVTPYECHDVNGVTGNPWWVLHKPDYDDDN